MTAAPSLPEIAKTALHLLDVSGLSALAHETIARELECQTSDVADAVPDTLVLLDLACDQVYAEIDLRPLDLPWAQRLELYATSYRQALLRHPNAAILVATRPIVSEASMVVAERALSELMEVGFDVDEANQVLVVISSFVLGHVLVEIGAQTEAGAQDPEKVQRFRKSLSSETLPLAARALAQNNDRDAEFNLGLKLLIDGLERRVLHQ